MELFTAIFWKRTWIWCKVNWKFILGLAIPIVVSIILRKRNTIEILKNASENKQKHFEIEMKAAGLEKGIKEKATKEFQDDVININKKHRETFEKIAEKERSEIDSAGSLNEETNKLENRFNLDIDKGDA